MSPSRKKCSGCGETIPDNAQFCPHCAAPQQLGKVICSNCSQVIAVGLAFCPYCNFRIADAYSTDVGVEIGHRQEDMQDLELGIYALERMDERKAKSRSERGKLPMIKILFLAANPSDSTRLRLDMENRAIDQSLRQAEFRNRFELKQHWAVRVSDIQELLLRHQPNIVHFSGHGSQSSEIILEDDCGKSQPVPAEALSDLFSILKDNICCVVLNACYSEQQAQSIASHIDCVLGMTKAIGDESAISFATAFYRALGYGRDIETAFKLGCLEINLQDLGEQNTPKLLALKVDPKTVVFTDKS
jgi:RNA polymerase subunit RPABC4/transcription elongation factor Spt4